MASTTSDLFDFSNPWLSAVIRTPEGVYPLWLNTNNQITGDKGEGPPIDDLGALAFLSEVNIEVQLAFIPKISLTLTPPYRQAVALLDSPLMNWGCNVIEVQFGYIGSNNNVVQSPLFSGVIMKPEVNLGSDITITMTAQGVSSMSASVQEGTRVFNDRTRLDMIEIMAKGTVANPKKEDSSSFSVPGFRTLKKALALNLTPPQDIYTKAGTDLIGDANPGLSSFIAAGGAARLFGGDATDFTEKTTRSIQVDADDVDADAKAKRLLKEEIRLGYVQGGKTDWQAITELCEEANCFFVWKGSTLKILPRSATYSGGKKVRTFRVFDYPRGAFGPAASVFPVLSASSPTMAVFLPGAARSVKLRGTDPETRKEVSETVDDSTENLGRTRDGGTAIAPCANFPSTDEETGDGGKINPGNPTDPNALNLAKSEYAKASEKMGVNLNIESLADPKLEPGNTIQVVGLGNRFDGNYVVFKASYTIGTSGGTMNLECVSNASAVDNVLKNKGKGRKIDKVEGSEEDNTDTKVPTTL